ncbi:MAG TPA: adenosine kinase, partial [Desulfopila sp.]|nr:adenosine kinase [Desulfopila sp.]
GIYYRNAFSMLGGNVSSFRSRLEQPTAQCLSLVTPDGERTMRTHLGAALTLAVEDITEEDFRGCDHAHIEGYLLFNQELMRHALKTAKAAGCTVSVDLASFEVVGAAKAELPELLLNYVDMVFANEEEAEAYAGTSDHDRCLEMLSRCCPIAVIKYGARGAVIRNGNETCRVDASPVERVIDTTGAGDMWAAGFLYGMGQGRTLLQSGECASLLGAAVVQHEGAALPEPIWDTLQERLHLLHDPAQCN